MGAGVRLTARIQAKPPSEASGGASGSAGAGSSTNPSGTTNAASQIGQHMPAQAIPELQSPDKKQLLNTFFEALDTVDLGKMQKLLQDWTLLVSTLNNQEPRTTPALTVFLKKIDDPEKPSNYYKLAYTLIDYQLKFDPNELNIFSNEIDKLFEKMAKPLYGDHSDFYNTISQIRQALNVNL